jgi:chromate transport protein ChrA
MIVLPAAAFTWLGMVLAISFLEAPLKFRAPGVTLRLGLGIGRVVFAALNRVELALLVVVGIALAAGPRSTPLVVLAAALAAVLAVQLGVLRPALRRRSERVLAGDDADAPRSRHHLVYIGLEIVKVVVLASLGVTALA